MTRSTERRIARLARCFPPAPPPQSQTERWLAAATLAELRALEKLMDAGAPEDDPLFVAIAAAVNARLAGHEVGSIVPAA